MNIITIGREFGSGGRELGKRLAEHLGYDYYDREIITAIAEKSGLDDVYVENALNTHILENAPLTFSKTITSQGYYQSSKTKLLLEQTSIIKEIASKGKNCVIVGRNADVILKDYNPFNIFVCAEKETKIRRCLERADKDENLSAKDIEKHMKKIDKTRAKVREILSDSKWGYGPSYHLVVNTTNWDLKELTPILAEFINKYINREHEH